MRRNLDARETRPGQSRPEEADTDIGGRESSERADSGDESCLGLEREGAFSVSHNHPCQLSHKTGSPCVLAAAERGAEIKIFGKTEYFPF